LPDQAGKLNTELVDGMIRDVDKKLSEQISLIMHHEKFKQMESAWRGLAYLVQNTQFDKGIKLEMLNVSKEDMRSDFENAMDLTQTGLFSHLYKTEYDQSGGEPFGAVIADYEFDRSSKDISMLRQIGRASSASHTPFIAAADCKMFGMEDATELHKIKDMESHFEQEEYTKWRGLREDEDSRYLGLTFPRFLLREPYSPESATNPVFDFNETIHGADGEIDHSAYCWGNAAYAFAGRMTESFAQNGWCVNIRGPQAGGKVEDLPVHLYQADGDTQIKVPTEVMISDRVEYELAESGFMPLTYYKNRDYACFFSAQSVQKPKKYSTPEATANSKLSANLPYMFLASRLSHYLKVIQRENIGSAKEKGDLQKELDEWIKGLVTEMPNPGPELKAKRPLKQGEVVVHDIEESPGWYKVEMFIRPHFQLEGMDVSLSLVSKMPKAEQG
jgi:type VI secretion system protein ImpC